MLRKEAYAYTNGRKERKKAGWKVNFVGRPATVEYWKNHVRIISASNGRLIYAGLGW